MTIVCTCVRADFQCFHSVYLNVSGFVCLFDGTLKPNRSDAQTKNENSVFVLTVCSGFFHLRYLIIIIIILGCIVVRCVYIEEEVKCDKKSITTETNVNICI